MLLSGMLRDGGRVRPSPDESGAGCDVPAAGSQGKPAMIAGDSMAKLLTQVKES
jgi:hypothetical protein